MCPSVKLKMVYSDYIKQRILFYHRSGKSLWEIVRSLAEEGHVATKAGVAKFIRGELGHTRTLDSAITLHASI